MHYHLEIITPPLRELETLEMRVDTILSKWRESYSIQDEEDEDESHRYKYGFYDWYVIGGRYSGEKIIQALDQEKLKLFYEELSQKNFTVSGVVAGKQRLMPESQEAIVDALWWEYFPELKDKPCLVFAHSNNQYDSKDRHYSDEMTLAEFNTTMIGGSRVMIAPHEDGDVEYMITKDEWNGANHVRIDWDGKIWSALTQYDERLTRYNEEHREKLRTKPDWLCITVDYHN